MLMNFNEIIEAVPMTAKLADVPQVTASYMPVPHMELLQQVFESISSKYDIVDANFSADSTGNKLVGTMDLSTNTELPFGMTVGIRNSYDKSMSVGLGIGGKVFVCSNGMFVADVQSLRKHTTNVYRDIEGILESQLAALDRHETQLRNDYHALSSTGISDGTVHKLIGELFIEHKLLTTTQIRIVRDELYNSDNFKMLGKNASEEDKTLWNFYNNVTESFKKSHPTRYFKDHSNLHKLLVERAELVL